MAAYGWTGKFLRVDLTEGYCGADDTLRYADYIGGRGIAARISWEDIPPDAKAFDPGNVLTFFGGPLTGTTAPFSGRTEVCGLAPQGWPVEWFTRAGMGGHWSPELKYAGWDGIAIKGESDHPVYLLIQDDKVEIRDARHLWGKGIYETQQIIFQEHGPDTRVACIGQAGENLSRIAIISTETESSAGQGGFGAVMGKKRLKAIAVKGSGAVQIARPDEFYRKTRAVAAECHAPHGNPGERKLNPEMVAKYCQKWQSCTMQCNVKCAQYYKNVPGVVFPETKNSGQFHCVAGVFPGVPSPSYYNWKLGFEAGFEAHKFTNDFGLNQWDIIFGIMPWLREVKAAGLLTHVDELEIDLDNPHFWYGVMKKISFGEGMGKVLAQGGWRAALELGIGYDKIVPLYTAFGYAGHWDGHGNRANYLVYPFWIVPSLQWAVDTRDPMSSGHGYAQNIMGWSPFGRTGGKLDWDQLKAVSTRLYGDESALDPYSGYEGKEVPAYWHANRSVIKDCVTVDDQMFPRIFSAKTADGWSRTTDPAMEGIDFEREMFVSATGVEMSPADWDTAADRIFNLERAIQIRNHGRTREHDEMVIESLELPEWWQSPLLSEKKGLDPEKFRALLSRYYEYRGWDAETGWPKRERLEAVGLADVADDLDRRGLLPS